MTKAVRATDVAVGDVVSFHDPSRAGTLITHRVNGVRRQGQRVALVTRGDANSGVERWSIDADGRLGRLALRIPAAGYALTWLTQPPITVALIALAVFLLAHAARSAPGNQVGRRRSPWALPALLGAMCLLIGPSKLAATEAAFSATTTNPASTFTAASSFCSNTQVVTSTADTFVLQALGNNNFGTNGNIAVTSASGANVRALVRFSLPALGGCTVSSAVLRLTVTSSNIFVTGRTIEARRVTSSWAENTVTWNTQPTSTTTSLASAASGAGPIDLTVTDQVTAMYSGSNDGFLIRDSVEGSTSTKEQQYSARENVSGYPQLTITYG